MVCYIYVIYMISIYCVYLTNIPYVHGGVRISYMHFSFAWSANLGHTSWHLKETVTRIVVYRVNALAKLW